MAKKAKSGVRSQYAPEIVMANWRELMQAIIHMNEEELKAALKFEVDRPKRDRRGDFIQRLHSKLVTLQIKNLREEAAEELAEMLP